MSRGSIGLDDRLNRYLADSHPPEHPVLAELRKRTAKMPGAEMQVAPEQGYLLAFLVRLIGAKNALEIGTFTGYSALAVALALPKDGHLIACDVNEAWTSIGRQHWEKAGVAGKTQEQIRLPHQIERDIGEREIDLQHRRMAAPLAQPLAEDEAVVAESKGLFAHQMFFTPSGIS